MTADHGAAAARRRRSVLWAPGDQPRKLERAVSCGADVVVFDLEDGVAADRKSVARDIVAEVLGDVDGGGVERLVRVCNGPSLREDVAAGRGADGICMPKVEGPDDLAALRTAMEDELGAPLPVLAIGAESPLGVLHAGVLAGATSSEVVAWMWGSEDLAAAIGCRARGPGEPFVEPLQWARSTNVLLAAATGTQAIDTVYPFFRDDAGLRDECRTAVAAGYSGKGVIHPGQVPVVNEAFTPTAEEVERSLAVVAAFADGAGIAVLDGQMLDLPHLRAAHRLLARADGGDVNCS